VSAAELTFIGLDLETSGVSGPHVSAPIQLGLAVATGHRLTKLVGGWAWNDDPTLWHGKVYDWSEEAYGVHGIPRGALMDPDVASANAVDVIGASWIKRNAGFEPRGNIAVGWSVGVMDFPYLKVHFPRITQTIAYRSIDLNALVLAISDAEVTDPDGRVWEYYRLKGYVREVAAEVIRRRTGEPARWHDAGYDAEASLHAFFAIQDILRGEWAMA
jgi:hypothetical protein